MYRYLSGRLRQLDIRQSDLGEMLGIGAPAISHRMTGRTPWTINEMYRVLDICQDMPDKLHIYFPKGGTSA